MNNNNIITIKLLLLLLLSTNKQTNENIMKSKPSSSLHIAKKRLRKARDHNKSKQNWIRPRVEFRKFRRTLIPSTSLSTRRSNRVHVSSELPSYWIQQVIVYTHTQWLWPRRNIVNTSVQSSFVNRQDHHYNLINCNV